MLSWKQRRNSGNKKNTPENSEVFFVTREIFLVIAGSVAGRAFNKAF